MRPSEVFGGHSDFVFLVEDLGRSLASQILGVSEGTMALWLAGDAEAPQMACMALYPWSNWYLQAVDLDHVREVGVLHALVDSLRGDLRLAQSVIDRVSIEHHGASNVVVLRRFSVDGLPVVVSSTLEHEVPA